MICPGAFGCEEQKDQIDLLAIQRIEIDGLFQPSKDADQTVQFRQFAVRNGDSVADSGRSKAFALQKCLVNITFQQAGLRGCEGGKLLEELLFRDRFNRSKNGLRRQNVGQGHLSLL